MSLRTLAEKHVSMEKACEMVGVEAYAGMKMECPFAWLNHPQDTRAMRLYPDSNSVYCFACRRKFTTVTLVAEVRGVTREKAAEQLLEAINYTPPDLESRWHAVSQQQEEEANTSYAAEALKAYCARIAPNWDQLQFDPEVRDKLTQCLSLLGQVKSRTDVEQWLAATKQAMTRVLGEKHGQTI